ncbi:hypothetical protein D9M72_413680 [compost metagenome]
MSVLRFVGIGHADTVLRPAVREVRVAHCGLRRGLMLFLGSGLRSVAGRGGCMRAVGRLVPCLRRPLAVRIIPARRALGSGTRLRSRTLLRPGTLLGSGLVPRLLERLGLAIRCGPGGGIRRGHGQLLQHAPCLMGSLKGHHDVVVGGHHLAG